MVAIVFVMAACSSWVLAGGTDPAADGARGRFGRLHSPRYCLNRGKPCGLTVASVSHGLAGD